MRRSALDANLMLWEGTWQEPLKPTGPRSQARRFEQAPERPTGKRPPWSRLPCLPFPRDVHRDNLEERNGPEAAWAWAVAC